MQFSDITHKEYRDICRRMESYHSVFDTMWSMGRPSFTTSIPTAAIAFDENGDYLEFLFNPDFWSKLSEYEKVFVICHECLHVILNHGARAKDSKLRDIANIALDIAVNHMLVDVFDFDRSKLSMDKDLCWLDTVLPHLNINGILKNKSYEFYYNILKDDKNIKMTPTLDVHSMLGDGPGSEPRNVSGIMEKIAKKMNNIEKSSLVDSLSKYTDEAGLSDSSSWKSFSIKYNPKRKWETVIKKWAFLGINTKEKTQYQWRMKSRRMAMVGSGIMLPTERDEDVPDKGKIKLWFFLDSSGSCISYGKRFFTAALSLPKDKFDINLMSFDTSIHKVDLDNQRIKGGGGTSFNIIEKHIQKDILSSKEEYPKAVFVITDGMGDDVSPERPNNWHIFLTSGSYVRCFPEECNFYKLSDFE